MERTRQKLHSCRGASILLALLLMLVATMVSAVIVGASLTAAKRVNDDRAQEQASLSISSAGRLMVHYLDDNNTCTQEKSIIETVHYDKDGNYEGEDNDPLTLAWDYNGIAGMLSEAIKHWDNPDYNNYLVIDGLFDGEDVVVKPAVLTFTLQQQNNVAEPEKMRIVKGTIFLVNEVPADLSSLGELMDQSPQKLFLSGTVSVDGPKDMGRFPLPDTPYQDGSFDENYEHVYKRTWTLSNLQLSNMP